MLCFGLSTAPQVFTRVFATVSAWAHSRGVRLAGPGLFGDHSQAARPRTALALSLPRHSDKRREVRPQPVAVCGVPRYVHRHSGHPSLPHSSAGREIPLDSETVSVTPKPSSSALVGVVGTHVIAGEAGSPRETQGAFNTVAPEVPLVLREGSPPPPGTPVPAGRGGSFLVDGEGPPPRGDALRNTDSGPSPAFGRVPVGVRSSPPRSVSVGDMVEPGELAAHKSARDESPVSSPAIVPGRSRRPSGDSDVRQFDGSRLCQQAGGTISDSLCSLTGQLLRWTESHNVHLEARYLPGQSNVLADLLSCRNQVLGTEWSLHPQVARKLIRTWGSPSLDLFATHLNEKLPLYCSLILDPQAVLEDAFCHPWNDLDTYAFPPFHLVKRVVAWIRETPNLSMTLVAPLWPEKAWFAGLLLLTQPPLALPLWD